MPLAGAPPLRFQEATPPPDLVSRPPAAAPPKPPDESPSTADHTPLALATAKKNPPAEHPVAPVPTSSAAESGEPGKAPPASILLDDTRPQVRPEDFLPFFQPPSATTPQGELTVVVPVPPAAPAPGTLPASSATYIQK